VLLSAQGMSPHAISEVVFTDPDTVRDVIHNFNRDGFDALYPRYRGGRPQTFTLPKRQESPGGVAERLNAAVSKIRSADSRAFCQCSGSWLS
jgi:transposase